MQIDFRLKGWDLVTPVMQRMGGVANAVYGKMSAGMNSLGEAAKGASVKVGDMFDNISKGASGAGDSVDRLNKQLNDLGGGMRGGGFGAVFGGTMAAGMVQSGVRRAADFVAEQAKDVHDLAMNASKIQADFKLFAGAGDGEKLYKDLSKFIEWSVYGPELYKEAANMLQVKMPANLIVPKLNQIGDITGGDAEKTHGFAYVYGQTKILGHLQMKDYQQYLNAGWNPLDAINLMNGTPMNKLLDMVSAGKVTSAMIDRAMEYETAPGGRFYNRLRIIGDTPYGREEAMRGSTEQNKQRFGESLLPAYNEFLTKLKPIVDDMPNFFNEIQPKANELISNFGEMVKYTYDHKKQIGEILGYVGDAAKIYAAYKFGTGVVNAGVSMAAGIGEIMTAGIAGTTIAGIGIGALALAAWELYQGYKKGQAEKNEISKGASKAEPVGKAMGVSLSDLNNASSKNAIEVGGHDWNSKFKPGMMVGDSLPKPKKDTSAIADVTDSIVGGGGKNVTFNFYKELVNQTVHVGKVEGVKDVTVSAVEQVIFRLMAQGKNV